MMVERLQKLISRAGVASRRAAEDLILAGRVTVDGKVVRELGAKADPVENKIHVDGKLLTFGAEKIFLLMNKPRCVICTAKDDRGRRTVLDLLAGKISERVYPVGRLDLDSEGLLLLTNDGELMNALIHPKFKVSKTYRVKVTGDVTEGKLDLLREGIELEDGMTSPAEIFLRERSGDGFLIDLTIREGRNRQVRRMFAAIGCDVKKLKRVEFAGLTLSGVGVGKFRRLSAAEVRRLRLQVKRKI